LDAAQARNLRAAVLAAAVIALVLGLGFAFDLPWATALWSWPDTRLSYLFVGSILTAIAGSLAWVGWRSEWGALPGGAINVFVIAATSALYFLFRRSASTPAPLFAYAVLSLLGAAFSAGLFFWSRRFPFRDTRPTPLVVRVAFGVFATVLLFAAIALILHAPIFPWPLNPDSSVVFGCVFLGDALYFIYGLFLPTWANAGGQLLAFLAYDLILIGPFLTLFASVLPDHRLSLILYVVVLVSSGSIAVTYLLINHETRIWRAPVPSRDAPVTP
jgi:hypothetical protein